MKIEVRPGCTRTKGCGSARETNKNKKVTSRLQLGLNFTVNVDFWFYNDDSRKQDAMERTLRRVAVELINCKCISGKFSLRY